MYGPVGCLWNWHSCGSRPWHNWDNGSQDKGRRNRDPEFHLASIREMLRVANEVRIFPLLTLGREVSPYVAPVVSDLASQGFNARVEMVPYEVQRGGHHMLRVRRGS